MLMYYTHRLFTIVNGGRGVWGAWSTCSMTCGRGMWKRYRSGDNPSPIHGGSIAKKTSMTRHNVLNQHAHVFML
jgi:leucine-rich repeat transmembrane protein FLRT